MTLSAREKAQRGATPAFGVIALIFGYTTIVNVVERPDGIKIATFLLYVRNRTGNVPHAGFRVDGG